MVVLILTPLGNPALIDLAFMSSPSRLFRL